MLTGRGQAQDGWIAAALRSAHELSTSAKALRRRLEHARAFSASEQRMLEGMGAWMVDGSPAQLLNADTGMLRHLNNATALSDAKLALLTPLGADAAR